jgi:SDR family mycofactocin-dependent oxidoreductase
LGKLAGKVALVTGAGRGQGRSHAIRLAEEGAHLILVDAVIDYASMNYPSSSEEDLAETCRVVTALGQPAMTYQADVRDHARLRSVVDEAVAEIGGLDVVCANAGICSAQTWDQVTPEIWRDTIEVNLTGVWNTIAVTTPHLIRAGGGSIICISSTAGIKGIPFFGPYVASKHGVVGIARSMANELARHRIRVNTVHPTGVETVMAEGLANLEQLIAGYPEVGPMFQNALPVVAVEPHDVSAAVVFLASDDSRYITGLEMTVDAGSTIR